MSTKIRKRSGHQVPFEMTKIFDAVDKAFNAAGKKTPATFKSILSQNSNKFQSLGTVERIQDELENLLLSCGHVDVYKKFSTYRGQRAIMREMKQSEVFKSIVNLEDNDITNDNANMSAVSPAGMMYKFGAESTKAFAKRYVLDPLITKELEDGYIHIHDLDHAAFGDFNCVSENAYITIKDETGTVMNTTLSFFNKFFTDDSQQVIELPQNYWIKGRNDWTLINKISRRKVGADDVLYKIRCNKGVGLDVTENHLIPVIRDNKEVLLRVKDLKVGDSLLKPTSFDLNLINQDYIDIVAELRRLDIIDGIYIYNVKQLNNYLRYKYDKGLWQLLDRRSNHLRYIKLEEYIKIIDNYDIPYEVIQTMQVAVMNGKTKLPLYLPITNELAEVIGYLHSEGSISFVSDAVTHKRSYAVSFCNKDERIVNKYKLAWKKSIGSRLGDYVNKQGCHIVTASSRLLCLLFSKILGGKNHAYNISVPDFIFNASDDIKWHYISALIDGDGCICNSCKTIRYTTICEKFAEQLVMLLNSVGIESSINTSFIDGRTVYFGDCKSRSHGDMHNVVVSHRQYVEKMLESLCGIKQRSVDVMYASNQISAVTCEPNKIRSIVQSSDTPYVFDLETVEHWFIANNIVVHNCIQSPMDKILKDGFSAHHGAIRGAKRIETAAFLMMISLETSQNEMFGGQGIPAFDFYLAPFVRLAYEQEIDKIAEVMDWSEDIIKKYKSYPITEYAEQYDDKYVNMAMKRVVDRVHQSMESFVHNANSIHSRGGNQTVFSSINYGTDTSPEGRCIIREILRACMEGVGNGATAIFPIHIFKCKEGVNKNPGDPNYDLYKMSWPVTARRFFPNYINLDASFYKNDWWKADDPNRYIYEPATMGALAGKEHLYIKIGEDIQDIAIQDLFEYCKTNVLKSKGDKHIQEKSGIEPGAGVYAITYIPEDVTYIGSSADINRRLAEHRCNIRLTGKIDAGFNPADRDLDNYKFEVLEYCENYKECEKQYIESTPNINFRGTSNKYYKSGNTKFDQHVTSRPKFVQDLSKKQELINIEHLNIKVLDRNNQWTLIKHIFKNDKHNSPYMMHIYYMEHGKEFCLSCTEDHPLYNGEGFTRADQLKVGDSIYRGDGLEMKISKITWHWEAIDSYDIGTASGSFVGSDIIMHNCRTSVFKDRFLDYPTTIGRGNLSFTTINLPMLALDAAIETGYYTKTKDGFECVGGGDLEDRKALFFKKLDKYCDITAKQLHDRYEMQAKTKALQYPLVMSRLYIGSENLKRNSEVREAIKHGTLSIGFVGLAEALIALTGKHHGESSEAQEIGLHIVEFIYKKCQAYSEQYDLNYSCFATPAESVAGKMEHITAARYGKIKDITDHGYFTNSNHVPVWYHCTPKHKAEIEGPYHKFTTAGHIFYVEADADLTKNPEAVDAVNRMAWANDVGYNAINHVSARCPRCSYEVHDGSDAPDHCPKCGEKMDKLARITGYLSSTVTKWNSGKIAEFKDRVIHE